MQVASKPGSEMPAVVKRKASEVNSPLGVTPKNRHLRRSKYSRISAAFESPEKQEMSREDANDSQLESVQQSEKRDSINSPLRKMSREESILMSSRKQQTKKSDYFSSANNDTSRQEPLNYFGDSFESRKGPER